MRETYRAKRGRQVRIQKEKQESKLEKKQNKNAEKYENRIKDRRDGDRRILERRNGDRRTGDRRAKDRGTLDRRVGERRSDGDRRFVERRDEIDRRDSENIDEEYEDIVAGRNAVLELIKSGKDINKIFIERGEKHGSINEIIAKAKEEKLVIVEVDRSKLDPLTSENHQGVVATVPPFNYYEVEDLIEDAKQKGEDPFILILERIEDPHNLGSIIRTAETAGMHGIIIPKRRTATVNSTVVKVSTGATSYVKIARVNNLNETIKKLKDMGLWIIGTDGEAETLYYNQDLKGPIAIIIGGEGFGMSKLVKENSDILVKIPMKGKITSLNASVSAGIVVYEAVRQRM